MQYLPGIRERLYVAGRRLTTANDGFKPVEARAETHERLADTSLQTSRPLPWDNCPVIVTKKTFTLSWSTVHANDMLTFLKVKASKVGVDVADWRPDAEEFELDATGRCELSRRIAIQEVAPAEYPRPDAATFYATEVLLETAVGSGAFATAPAYTLGAVTALKHQPFTFDTLQTQGKRVIVVYCPLYYFRVISHDIGYSLGQGESRVLTFEEIA